MQGKIAHISVIWAERTNQGTRFRIYDVLPDDEKIIRTERMEELVDDLSLICQQLQQARDRMPNTTATAGTDRVIRRTALGSQRHATELPGASMTGPSAGRPEDTLCEQCTATFARARAYLTTRNRPHPNLQATRFGLQADERDAFIAAYGQDIRAWPGYQTLHDIRELSTTSALLRDAHRDPTRRHELKVRLRTLRFGDDLPWTAF